jgi:hypothetical protein
MAKAIWEKNPDIILVVGDFAYHQNIVDPFNFRGAASRITTLAGHQRILQLARQYDREVWFDVHVGTEGPLPEDTLQGLFSFRDALQRIADGARCNVVVFEFNAGNHQQKRALANALAIQAIERDGHIPIAISANGLQPDNQNDNDWDQGLLFLNPEKVWLQPPGYVTQMLSTHYVPLQVPCTVVDAKKQLDVHAKMSADHKTLVLQVVNPGESAVKTQIQLDGFVAHDSAAKVTELCGALDSANTAARPDTIIPKQSWYHYSGHEGNMDRTFAPYSFTIIKFSGKKQALMTHAMKHRHSL